MITPNREDLDEYSHHNILVIEGCSTEEEILEKAGVEKAKGHICTMDSEVDNIVTVLTARNLNDKIYIISNSISKSGAEKLMKVGANKTLSSVEISGKRMAALMIKPNIISFLDVFTRVGDVLIVLGREDPVEKLRHLGDEIK